MRAPEAKELTAKVTFKSYTHQPMDYFISFSRQAAQAMKLNPSKTIFPIKNTSSSSFQKPLRSDTEPVKNEIVEDDLSKVSYEIETRWSVNKSPFIYAKHQDQFEMRNYIRELEIYDSEVEVVKRWLHYVSQNLPAGVAVEYELIEKEPLKL
jgi:ribosomal protein S10